MNKMSLKRKIIIIIIIIYLYFYFHSFHFLIMFLSYFFILHFPSKRPCKRHIIINTNRPYFFFFSFQGSFLNRLSWKLQANGGLLHLHWIICASIPDKEIK